LLLKGASIVYPGGGGYTLNNNSNVYRDGAVTSMDSVIFRPLGKSMITVVLVSLLFILTLRSLPIAPLQSQTRILASPTRGSSVEPAASSCRPKAVLFRARFATRYHKKNWIVHLSVDRSIVY
jgi:hypothetical protein